MKIIMLGAPGAGKGTQAKMIADKYEIPHISTGDIFRANIKNQTELGMKAKSYMDQGALVPDELTVKILLDRVAKDDCKDGYILDGFPRTLAQAEAMTEANIDIDCALMIDVADEDIIARIGGRRVCSKCGATYHTKFKPSSKGDVCEQCDGKLEIRADDAPETVVSRLETYHNMTAPVIDYYDKMGKLVAVKAVEGVEETTELVLKALGK